MWVEVVLVINRHEIDPDRSVKWNFHSLIFAVMQDFHDLMFRVEQFGNKQILKSFLEITLSFIFGTILGHALILVAGEDISAANEI